MVSRRPGSSQRYACAEGASGTGGATGSSREQHGEPPVHRGLTLAFQPLPVRRLAVDSDDGVEGVDLWVPEAGRCVAHRGVLDDRFSMPAKDRNRGMTFDTE